MSHLPSFSIRNISGYLFSLSFFLFSPGIALGNDTPESILLRYENFSEPVSGEILGSLFSHHTDFFIDPRYRSEIENQDRCAAPNFACRFFQTERSRASVRYALVSTPDTNAITAYLAELSGRFDTDPKNTTLAVKDGKVVVDTPSENGRKLHIAESALILVTSLSSRRSEKTIIIDLSAEVKQPELAIKDPSEIGITDLIGEGTTNFRGSPKNRIYNIHRALEQFQGLLVAPNEEFSFVHYLGEVDGEHGYLPELVIKHNRTEPEFGGGICQVSSTVFRAAINTGLKITERRNHAYPVQYYKPYGMDATIYIPKPDLRFKNNTEGHIFIQSVVEGTQLTFQVFGKKDGRSVTVDGPHILESNPDGSMKTLFTQIVTDSNGTELIRDNFWSNYKSPALFPHPGEEILTEKPKNWSERQWKEYKKTRST